MDLLGQESWDEASILITAPRSQVALGSERPFERFRLARFWGGDYPYFNGAVCGTFPRQHVIGGRMMPKRVMS